jgi:hypothetical protein
MIKGAQFIDVEEWQQSSFYCGDNKVRKTIADVIRGHLMVIVVKIRRRIFVYSCRHMESRVALRFDLQRKDYFDKILLFSFCFIMNIRIGVYFRCGV